MSETFYLFKGYMVVSVSPKYFYQFLTTVSCYFRYDREPKPSRSPSLEEDEGFSDWTQRKEKQRQQRLQELSQDGEEEENEETVFMKNNKAVNTLPMPFSPVQKHDQDDINTIRMKIERMKDYEEKAKTVKGREEITDRVLLKTKKEIQRRNTEVRVLY